MPTDAAPASFVLRGAEARDIDAIVDIRNHAVQHGVALWTDQLIDDAGVARWFSDAAAAGRPFLVAERDGAAVAYATYGPWRPQVSGFLHSVENSVYVAAGHQGVGIGRALLIALIEHAREAGFHVMVADIDATNEVSIRLHERLGFRNDGTLREVGTKFGRWLDLTLMSLRLNDRQP